MSAPVDVWVRVPDGDAWGRERFLSEVVQTYGMTPRFDRTCRLCGHPDHGKPHLVGSSDLDVSLARAGPVAVVAVGQRRTVGVDVETVDRLRVDLRSAAGVFSAEESVVLSQASDWRLLTLVLWTRKEAVVKATGKGLTYPLDQVTVAGRGTALLDGQVFEVDVEGDSFGVATFMLGGGEVVSLAVTTPWPGVRWREAQPACWPDAARPSLVNASHRRA